jgi:hypothetical protein
MRDVVTSKVAYISEMPFLISYTAEAYSRNALMINERKDMK